MSDDDGRRDWLREVARFAATFALFVAIDEWRGGNGMDDDFPTLLAEILAAALLVSLLVRTSRWLRQAVRARRAGRRGAPAPPRPPGSPRFPLLVVLVGLPVLVGLLILGARLWSAGWAPAVERTVTSPYSWIIVVVYLGHALAPGRTEPAKQRRWPMWRLAENVVAAFLWVGLVSGDLLPDRWYGTLGETVLALLAATAAGDVALRVFGAPAGPDQEAAVIPMGPSRGPSSLAG
ncbi:hypothetical protein ACN26Y_03280 [Micromonospora sp. WMMD558]|uniref:hypothetical protein n=1 Tax=Micromonospora sp. WMMD558 TaxID=3403462 RepID=UPI003BF4BFD1